MILFPLHAYRGEELGFQVLQKWPKSCLGCPLPRFRSFYYVWGEYAKKIRYRTLIMRQGSHKTLRVPFLQIFDKFCLPLASSGNTCMMVVPSIVPFNFQKFLGRNNINSRKILCATESPRAPAESWSRQANLVPQKRKKENGKSFSWSLRVLFINWNLFKIFSEKSMDRIRLPDSAKPGFKSGEKSLEPDPDWKILDPNPDWKSLDPDTVTWILNSDGSVILPFFISLQSHYRIEILVFGSDSPLIRSRIVPYP